MARSTGAPLDEILGGTLEPGVVAALMDAKQHLHQTTARHATNLLGSSDTGRRPATAMPSAVRFFADARATAENPGQGTSSEGLARPGGPCHMEAASLDYAGYLASCGRGPTREVHP